MSIFIKVTTLGKSVAAICLVLLLTACKQDITLFDANNAVVGNGVLEISANFPSPIRISMDGQEFSGTWARKKIYEAEIAKRHRLISTRSYAEYMRGDSANQLYLGHTILKAKDGTEMKCDFYYRTQPKAGQCTVDGIRLTINLAIADKA